MKLLSETLKISVLGILWYAALLILPAAFADAAVIFQQLDDSTLMDGGATNVHFSAAAHCFDITSSTGDLDQIDYIAGTYGSTITTKVAIVRTYTDDSCSVGQVEYNNSGDTYFSPFSNVTNNTLIQSTALLSIPLTGVGSIRVQAARTSAQATCGSFPFNCSTYGTGSTPYIVLYDSIPADTTTRIVSQTEPENGTTTPSATVDFEFDYYYNDTTHSLDVAGVRVQNMITGATVLIEEPITEGANTFTSTETLMTGAQYSWSPYLASNSTGLVIQNGAATPAWQFFTVTSPYPLDTGTIATSSEGATGFFADTYSGFITLLTNNPPFRDVVALVNVFRDLSTTTAAVTLSLPQGITDNITDPIRTAIGWLVVILMGIYMLKRLTSFSW